MQQIVRLKLYPSAPEDGGSELAQKTECYRDLAFPSGLSVKSSVSLWVTTILSSRGIKKALPSRKLWEKGRSCLMTSRAPLPFREG
jgi:hypothetical protein